jgi:hypothetical protein
MVKNRDGSTIVNRGTTVFFKNRNNFRSLLLGKKTIVEISLYKERVSERGKEIRRSFNNKGSYVIH